MVHRQGGGYAKERELFGKPIGKNQGVQFPIAHAYAQMRAAELMVRGRGQIRGRRRRRPGGQYGEAARRRRFLVCRRLCVQTFGGFGFAEEYDVERKFRETRLYRVAPISTNMILSYLAEHVLGLPRSY